MEDVRDIVCYPLRGTDDRLVRVELETGQFATFRFARTSDGWEYDCDWDWSFDLFIVDRHMARSLAKRHDMSQYLSG